MAKAAKHGKTVAELKDAGATALGNAELQALVPQVRNTVTGQYFDILYSSDGQRLITSVDGKQTPPSEVLTMMHGGQVGVSSKYEIKDGKIITTLGGVPFEVAVYKTGDKYVAARSNEFGFVNYEVEEVKEVK